MRALAVFSTLALALLAGCADEPDPAAESESLSVTVATTPEPVAIHDVINLVQGGQQTWTFEVGEGATVSMRFYATGKAVVGAGLPTCLSFETPDESAMTGICQGNGAGNILIAPYIVQGERVFYERGADAAVGSYTFTLNGQPSATDFHAVVNVSYDDETAA